MSHVEVISRLPRRFWEDLPWYTSSFIECFASRFTSVRGADWLAKRAVYGGVDGSVSLQSVKESA